MAPTFPVPEYIANNPDALDPKHFAAMREAGSVEQLPNRNGVRRLTAVGGWSKRLNHWGCIGCLTTGVPYDNLYIPYAR